MEQTIETWRAIAGYESFYQVSDAGRVRSHDRVVDDAKGQRRLNGKVLRPGLVSGYEQVVLCQKSLLKSFYVHRIVAVAFIGPCPAGKQVNHRDGDKLNNRLSNLEYVTAAQNTQHAYRMGLSKAICGANHYRAKLTDKDVLEIRAAYAAGGVTQRKLADNFGVHRVNISNIVNRQTWAHLPPA